MVYNGTVFEIILYIFIFFVYGIEAIDMHDLELMRYSEINFSSKSK